MQGKQFLFLINQYIRQFYFCKLRILQSYFKQNIASITNYIMNQSYQRALNEVSMLKKTLNSEKTSHQNTLQQLETTYQIIEQMKQLLKNQQQRNKSLAKEIREKDQKIQQLSSEYEDHIINIKQLIDRKDLEIKKYSQIKVTDYDMIRLRVINQVETQHTEEIENYKQEIKKLQYLNNQSIYQIKVLREKNQLLIDENEKQKEKSKSMQQQITSRHTKQLSKVFTLLEQQKVIKKQVEKKLQLQKSKHNQIIKRYHIQLQTVQTQLIHLSNGKENHRKYSNFNMQNNSSILQLKQSQFIIQNQKLKRQAKQKQQQIQSLTKKYKNQLKQAKQKIIDLENLLNQSKKQLIIAKNELQQYNGYAQKDYEIKLKRQKQKKQKQLKELKQQYNNLEEMKNREINKIKKQFQELNKRKNQFQSQQTYKEDTEDNIKLRKNNNQLNAEIKKLNFQLTKIKQKSKDEPYNNRQVRSVSVQQVKDKLKVANAQIVTLLKEKIALNEKISRISEKK